MRYKLPLFAVSAALAIAANAAIDVGDGIKVVPNVIVGVEFNDNLFLSSTNEQNETLTKISPGVLFSMGEGAVSTAKFSYNEQFQLYNNESDLNTSLSLLDFNSRYDDGKMAITADAWWHEANQATRDSLSVSRLVKRNLFRAAFSDEVQWTEKSSAKVGITYDSTDYKPAGYTDWKWWEIPVNYYYKIQPKLDASFGLRYRNNNLTGNPLAKDSDEFFYNVGLRGEISPKLTAEIAVGYIQFKPDAGASDGALGVDGTFRLAVTPKSNLSLNGYNHYGYSGFGDAYRTNGLSFSADTALTTALTVRGNVYYSSYAYLTTTRKDDYYGGSLSATYTLNEHVEFTGGYVFSKNDSNQAAYDFNNSIVSLAATLKY